MPRLMQAIAAAAMVSFCASCATVTRGTTEQIQIVSDPPGAEARTSMGFCLRNTLHAPGRTQGRIHRHCFKAGLPAC